MDGVHHTADVVTEHCGALHLHNSHEELYYVDGYITYCPGTYQLVS